MSLRSPFGPPCTAGAPEGRLPFGRILLWGVLVLAGTASAACGGLTTHDEQGDRDGTESPGGDRDGAPIGGDDPLGSGSPGSAGDGEGACSCGANPAVLVLETADGSNYEFADAPPPSLFPQYLFNCTPPGPASLECGASVSLAACDDDLGCLILNPPTHPNEALLTWYDNSGTSVTQVRGRTSEVIIEVADEGLVAGYFSFGTDTGLAYWGKFTLCPVALRDC